MAKISCIFHTNKLCPKTQCFLAISEYGSEYASDEIFRLFGNLSEESEVEDQASAELYLEMGPKDLSRQPTEGKIS